MNNGNYYRFHFIWVHVMRLRNRRQTSPVLPFTDPPTPIPSASSDNNGDSASRSSSGNSTMVTFNYRSQGTCFGDVYFPAPFILNEADYISYSMLFAGAPRFNRDQLDNGLLINIYVTKYWLLGGLPVSIIDTC